MATPASSTSASLVGAGAVYASCDGSDHGESKDASGDDEAAYAADDEASRLLRKAALVEEASVAAKTPLERARLEDECALIVEALHQVRVGELLRRRRTVLIYSGGDTASGCTKGCGVDQFTVELLQRRIQDLGTGWEIEMLTASPFLERLEMLDPRRAVCVLPGGNATGYDRALKSAVDKLSHFQQAGSGVVTLCAGAFWTARTSRYHLGDGVMLERKRDWVLYPGTAEGPIIPPGYDRFSKRVVELGIRSPFEHRLAKVSMGGLSGTMTVSGGGEFLDDVKGTTQAVAPVLLYDASCVPPSPRRTARRVAAVAIRDVQNPEAGNIVASMVHPEYRPRDFDSPPMRELLRASSPTTREDLDGLRSCGSNAFKRVDSYNDLVLAQYMSEASESSGTDKK